MTFSIEEKYIIETESDLDVKFPPDFKNQMMISNGGEVVTDNDEFELFPFFDKSDRKKISRTCNHIGLETKNARQWEGFPEKGIAIGSDGFGNLLILCHDGEGNLGEEIFFWNHETGEVEKIAESIQELEE